MFAFVLLRLFLNVNVYFSFIISRGNTIIILTKVSGKCKTLRSVASYLCLLCLSMSLLLDKNLSFLFLCPDVWLIKIAPRLRN